MSTINTKQITETSWSGSRIDFELSANLTSIITNCTNILKNIEKLQSYQGKRATDISETSYELNDYEKAQYGDNIKKYTYNYKVWKLELGNNNYSSYLGKIKEEIQTLQEYIKENNVQFAQLERSAEEIAQEYNKILAAISASGIDIGGILLHKTNATKQSGESGDRTLKGDYSGIKDENFYLYEGLKDGEYLYVKAGTGVEAGTFFIYKHTKDGREVPMKNISGETAKDWINNSYKAKQDKDKKTRDKLIKGLAPVGAGIIGLGNKIKGAVNDKVNRMQAAQSAINKAQTDGEKRTNQLKAQNTVDKDQRDGERRTNQINEQKEKTPPEKAADSLKKQTEQLQEDVNKIRDKKPATAEEAVDNLKKQNEQLQEDANKIKNKKPATAEEVVDTLKKQNEQLKKEANKNQAQGGVQNQNTNEGSNNSASPTLKKFKDINGEEHYLTHVATKDGKTIERFVDKNGNIYHVTSKDGKQISIEYQGKDTSKGFGSPNYNPKQTQEYRERQAAATQQTASTKDAQTPPPATATSSTGASVVESGTSSTGIAIQDGTGRPKDVINVDVDTNNKTTTYTLSDESKVTIDNNNNVVNTPNNISGLSGGTYDEAGNYNSNDGKVTILANDASNQSTSETTLNAPFVDLSQPVAQNPAFGGGDNSDNPFQIDMNK